MGVEDVVSEVSKAVANGTTPVEKAGEPVIEKKEEQKDGVKEMEDDSEFDENVETQKMDVDKEEVNESKKIKEVKEVKESKEEPKSEAMEEEIGAKPNEESEDEIHKIAGSKEEEEKPAVVEVEKGLKRGKKKVAGEIVNTKKMAMKEKEEQEQKTPVISAIDRPVRQRKSVERLVASIEKEAVKEFHIEKGLGTPLKDIPNVAFKLSKRKTDDTLKLLHTLLFGRRAKAFQVKNNISQFSGYVWHENEEKQKIKIKEKFDKCLKEKLMDFCHVLDIPIGNTNTRKEDIVAKLIDFLVAPHATTTELLTEKEQSSKSKKRKRVSETNASMSGNKPSKRSHKSQKKIEDASKGEEKNSTPDSEDELEEEEKEEEHEEQENLNGDPERSEDETPEQAESDMKQNKSEGESEEDFGKRRRGSKKSATKKESTEKAKIKKTTTHKKSSPLPKRTHSNPSSNHSKVEDNSDTSPKTFSRKKKNEVVVSEKFLTPKKSTSKEKTGKKDVKGKEKPKEYKGKEKPKEYKGKEKPKEYKGKEKPKEDKGKEKPKEYKGKEKLKEDKGKDKPKEDKLRPSDDELRNAICEILKEVDFNTATFTDILKQLVKRFNTDLMPRKSSIKIMIQDELTKIADEEEDEGEAEKNEKQPSRQGVRA